LDGLEFEALEPAIKQLKDWAKGIWNSWFGGNKPKKKNTSSEKPIIEKKNDEKVKKEIVQKTALEQLFDTWKTIPSHTIIDPKNFIGLDFRKANKMNCFKATEKQVSLAKNPVTPMGPAFQIQLQHNDGNGKPKGAEYKTVIEGINYLKNELENGRPGFVGIFIYGFDNEGAGNKDNISGHWFTATGMGYEKEDPYLRR
jgi:hypothetical protein